MMNVYVITNKTTGKLVGVSARPFADIVLAYGAKEWGTKEVNYTAQGAFIVRKHETLEVQITELED